VCIKCIPVRWSRSVCTDWAFDEHSDRPSSARWRTRGTRATAADVLRTAVNTRASRASWDISVAVKMSPPPPSQIQSCCKLPLANLTGCLQPQRWPTPIVADRTGDDRLRLPRRHIVAAECHRPQWWRRRQSSVFLAMSTDSRPLTLPHVCCKTKKKEWDSFFVVVLTYVPFNIWLPTRVECTGRFYFNRKHHYLNTY